MVIARRLQAIRDIAAEKNEQLKSGELARQFQIMCERSALHGGPISTAEMALLASELVPEATARLHEPERIAA
jgi:creatinine amidohydrolase/Fe(II)-dependent formamide hydrolase-like protein